MWGYIDEIIDKSVHGSGVRYEYIDILLMITLGPCPKTTSSSVTHTQNTAFSVVPDTPITYYRSSTSTCDPASDRSWFSQYWTALPTISCPPSSTIYSRCCTAHMVSHIGTRMFCIICRWQCIGICIIGIYRVVLRICIGMVSSDRQLHSSPSFDLIYSIYGWDKIYSLPFYKYKPNTIFFILYFVFYFYQHQLAGYWVVIYLQLGNNTQMHRNIFKLFKSSIPLLALTYYTAHPYHNFFWRSKKQPNLIKDRVFLDAEISNKPCEDRSSIQQLKSINGYAVAVFDGHGGWQVSHLCSKVLLDRLDECLARNKDKIKDEEQLIKTSLKDAFWAVESQFLQTARKGYQLGFGRMARAGSCALVCVVANNKVYAANAGDSVGLIIEQDQKKTMKYTQINRELNANNPEERQRLRKLFPTQEDVVICKKPNETSCYIKGRLQPTRSLGDLRLKHPQFNNPADYSTDHDYQSPLKVFTGPYITWEPEIKVFPLKESYKSVILASDGLWDELERQQVAELFKNNPVSKMPKILIQKAMQKAANDAQKTVKQIRQIPQGKKRKIHDDITVIVVDLQGQYK